LQRRRNIFAVARVLCRDRFAGFEGGAGQLHSAFGQFGGERAARGQSDGGQEQNQSGSGQSAPVLSIAFAPAPVQMQRDIHGGNVSEEFRFNNPVLE
jgi:hypothetical protein